MKSLRVFLVIAIFVNGSNLFAQSNQLPAVMYVTTNLGLIQRERPSTNSARLGAYAFGERVIVVEQGPRETIGGNTNYWYRTRHDTWVFGGFLSEEFPEGARVILGTWEIVGNNNYVYMFHPDDFFASGYKESGDGNLGSWILNGNVLLINITSSGYEDVNETLRVTYTVIDKNNIVLTYPSRNVFRLTRSNDPWVN